MLLDRFSLRDKKVLVTGAGRGIGQAIAVAFAEMGADVVLAARTRESLEETATLVRGFGREAVVIPTDVTDRAQLEALAERATHALGRIDVLVNNAGGGPYKKALETSEKLFEGTIRLSLTSAFLLTRLIAPGMIAAGGGAVLNISSAIGHVPSRGFVAYGVAKAGLDQMTRLLGQELAPKIRVNALALGAIETPALAPALTDPRMRAGMIARTPMRRLGTTEDVALAALYLCSDAGSYVTGKVVEVDGGIEASNFPIDMPDL
jgi:7-alpha-hydroxysteroid dehydrogenase